MAYAHSPGAGFRRFDAAAAQAEKLAVSFTGLPDGRGPGHALAAFKRAATYIGVPASVVQLIDVMFSWTKAEDWRPGNQPIVWPRNEKLARKLGVQVRQVQNLLDRAIALKLISHRDSPNGHRGGARDQDGSIKWAYGIVLSPIGTRFDEFMAIAERGAAQDERIDQLKRRLASVRRRIASLAQTASDHELKGTNAEEELELVLMATRQMRGVRDVELLAGCVDRIEARGQALEAVIAATLLASDAAMAGGDGNHITCSDANHCIHSTTTIESQTANAVTRNGSAEKSRRKYDIRSARPQTEVEDDLEKHGVDPQFIESTSPELCHSLESTRREWSDVIVLAERLAEQNAIHRQAWSEACRLMGDRGAAASVIATVHKYRAGEVRRPGAYLRGMSDRAARGELHLGRTFHGLKDLRQSSLMQSMQDGSDPRSIGEIARRAMTQTSLVLSGRTS
jgi:replication initiation protein RepC